MIPFDLEIRYASELRFTADALLLNTSDVSEWLRIACAWSSDHHAVRFYPISSSSTSLEVGQVLIAGLVPDRIRSWTSVASVVMAKAFPNLFVPANSYLVPIISESEFSDLAGTLKYLVLPGNHWIGFEPDEILSMKELVELESMDDSHFSAAHPGVHFSNRLNSITVFESPSVEDVFQSGRDDIGSQTQNLSELPPSPNEPGVGQTMSENAMRQFARMVNGFTNMFPANASEPTWLNRMQDWAQSKMFGGVDQNKRNKEINRLLNLLKADPDQGLKFAIPLGGGGAPRGMGFSGNELSSRSIDFSLSGISGGGSVDFWDMEIDQQHALQENYRKLASREIALGRFRRAAFIYAELLGDLATAASTLVAGGHFREAAVIYRDRLNRPLEAAKCLESGGLMNEAIVEYEKLKRWEDAGELYLKIDQVENAHQAFRKKVDEYVAQQQIVHAAKLLISRLDQTEEACSLLYSAWPHHNEAPICIRKWVQVQLETGHSDQVLCWIKELKQDQIPNHLQQDTLEFLVDLQQEHDSNAIGTESEERVMVMTSHWLKTAPRGQLSPLTKPLQTLRFQDRLISKDCRRFVEKNPNVPPRKKPKLSSQAGGTLKVAAATAQLSKDYVWVGYRRCGEIIYACGWSEKNLRIARIDAPKLKRIEYLDLPKQYSSGLNQDRIVFDVTRYSNDLIFLNGLGDNGKGSWKLFAGQTIFPANSNIVSGRYWSPQTTGLLSCGRNRFKVIGRDHDGITISQFETDSSGEVVQLVDTETCQLNRFLGAESPLQESLPVPMAFHSNQTLMGWGNVLLLSFGGFQFDAEVFDSVIRNISVSAPQTRRRFAVGLDKGVRVFWDGLHSGTETQLREIENPITQFNRSGQLIVIGENEGQVFGTFGERLTKLGWFSILENTSCRAILSGAHRDNFFVGYSDGTLQGFDGTCNFDRS